MPAGMKMILELRGDDGTTAKLEVADLSLASS